MKTSLTPQEIPNPALFFNLSADLFCVAGYDGYFKLVNPAFLELLGYSEAEIYSKPISAFIYEYDRSITDQHRETLKKNIPLLHYENRYQAKSGEIHWLSWTSIPNKEQQLIYAIAKNITHQKQAEADRNSLLLRLTTNNQQLKQLSYTTSHDLRSPVNNLLAVMELLDIEKGATPERLSVIEILKLATLGLRDSLNAYIDQLHNHDRLLIALDELALADISDAIAVALRSLLKNTRTRIITDFSAAPTVYFNKAYLESIFLNMITNSVKYAQPDLDPVIQIRSEILNDQVRLHFIDNGRGFNMSEVKDRIFGLNQTFHNHIDSKGIGLYLVYNHITSLGGHIVLDSQPNQGAHFTLTFIKK